MQKAMKRSKTTQIRGSTSTNKRNKEQIQLTGKLADGGSASPASRGSPVAVATAPRRSPPEAVPRGLPRVAVLRRERGRGRWGMGNEAANGVAEKVRRHAPQNQTVLPLAPHVIDISTNQNHAQPTATDHKINGGQNRVTDSHRSHV
jgi:hypothetical protein